MPDSRSIPLTAAWAPEITTAIAHLREVLGDEAYESFARKGETMSTAEMVTYAYDQIDQARTELEPLWEMHPNERQSEARTSTPLGVMTFLFTDIEGSTRRWEADAEAMRAALAPHDAVLRSAIDAHGGWLFKHTGDGVCAAFASPKAAVDAAVAAQRGLELPVRMGIATGEAELRGTDYFGAVLNRAARVMAAAMAANPVRGVDRGSGQRTRPVVLGPRRLRDMPTRSSCFRSERRALIGEHTAHRQKRCQGRTPARRMASTRSCTWR